MWGRGLLLASTAVVGVRSNPGANNVEPCAYIATLQSEGASSFPAGSAFDCLNSVPVDVEGDKKLIDELKIAWQWHSDISWLKNPPADWEDGSLDLIAELDKIKSNLEQFESEYQVQIAIQKITVRSGNFHLNYIPDILQVFGWQRDVSLVALSDDGVKVPKLYVTFDALKVADGNITEEKISDITKINGADAWPYLENLAQWEQYRDTDGRLNSLWAKGDTLTPGAFMMQSRFDGAETNITFANGTEIEYINTAWTNEAFKDVKDGKSFYEKFCKGSISGVDAADNELIWKPEFKSKRGPTAVPPNGEHHSSLLHRRETPAVYQRFPEPVVSADSGGVAGYFLDGEGYDDIAVLKIMSFAPEKDPYGLEFQTVVDQFLVSSKNANKNRLIIDLRENDGGSMQLLLDTFEQLFPHRAPWQGARYRANPHFKLIGDAVSEIYNNDTIQDYYKETWNGTFKEHYRHWAYSHFLDAQNKGFESWAQFKGPELFNGDQYTKTMRYNLSNEDDISVRLGGFKFTDETNRTTVFNHTDIVMFTDALCGSACAAIHEEFKNNAGIRSVTVGGRAIEGPIQAVSGNKGGEVVPLIRGIQQADRMRNISRTFSLESYPADEATLDEIIDTPELQRRAGDDMTRVQAQLMMRKGDKSSKPLQYTYEAADCRIFYTHESFADPVTAWKQVWGAFLDPESKCVKNSTGHKSSLSGGFVPYGPWTLKDEDLPKPESTETSEEAAKGSPEGTDFEGVGSREGASVIALFATVAIMLMQL
ncbi:uncharacterized protein CC84DRAFT_1216541 [Paraphaeosphaeria sporulosa]|uniref:Uncharacterized protein n=1 Tax=Paraphaeosphaeria sporulosa TaxID=1460663 RepID=A0A177CJB0_9PLEO|nr:uncharacterized protein CC84DRAFT_1216541 [Paraphaeosphaeria sporulosa]OAG07605.1 hypothetical protein CC84DRAFT_1216541 [Paraphaeosphaeria sporulosa]